MTPLRRKTRLRTKGRLRSSSARTGAVAYRAWAMDVKVRDGCCQVCRATEGLEAHHVYPKGKYPDLRLVPENGLALCRVCHREWHSATTSHRSWWETWWPERHRVILGLLRAS